MKLYGDMFSTNSVCGVRSIDVKGGEINTHKSLEI